ncbi:hypothetical protein ACFTWS_36250 [Streptomyces sp. NPDC057027]|uniref:hypothetical protein n=1 Tax=Streptomyces sp. NPDC057027 TaxID=3346004 RepID=UPI00362C1B98
MAQVSYRATALVPSDQAVRLPRPFSGAPPGEIGQVGSTRPDVMAVLDDGVVARPEVTIAVDVTTRTICATLLRTAGTKGADAAVLPARMLVPESMRPGWIRTLVMADSTLPHQRLMAVDKRLELAAAKPVIVPDTIVIDHGKAFASEAFSSTCSLLGISLQPARPRTQTDKAIRPPSTHAANDAGPAAPAAGEQMPTRRDHLRPLPLARPRPGRNSRLLPAPPGRRP